MTTIEAIPVTTDSGIEDSSAVALHAEDTPAEHIEQDPVEQVVEVAELPREVKRKPGRPAGSKSKIPGKPRAPRRVVVECEARQQSRQEVPEEIPDVIAEERPLPNSRPIPTHGYDDRTVMMIAMLQRQADDRKNRKAALYKSWFS